jgi:hypothetical protein
MQQAPQQQMSFGNMAKSGSASPGRLVHVMHGQPTAQSRKIGRILKKYRPDLHDDEIHTTAAQWHYLSPRDRKAMFPANVIHQMPKRFWTDGYSGLKKQSAYQAGVEAGMEKAAMTLIELMGTPLIGAAAGAGMAGKGNRARGALYGAGAGLTSGLAGAYGSGPAQARLPAGAAKHVPDVAAFGIPGSAGAAAGMLAKKHGDKKRKKEKER